MAIFWAVDDSRGFQNRVKEIIWDDALKPPQRAVYHYEDEEDKLDTKDDPCSSWSMAQLR
jgi:hypothetical protein